MVIIPIGRKKRNDDDDDNHDRRSSGSLKRLWQIPNTFAALQNEEEEKKKKEKKIKAPADCFENRLILWAICFLTFVILYFSHNHEFSAPAIFLYPRARRISRRIPNTNSTKMAAKWPAAETQAYIYFLL